MAMMISKFNKLIQSKLVWGIFAALISVAFVLMSIPSCSGSGAQKPAKEQTAGKLFGEEISRNEFVLAYQSSRLNYTMQYGPFRTTDRVHQLLVEAAWKRLAILKKAEQLDMKVTDEQLIGLIQRQPLFQNPQTQQFDMAAYENALQQIQGLTGMGPGDVENHYREEILIQRLSSVPAQGALVTEEEIKQAFHRFADKRTVEYALIPTDSVEKPSLDDEAVKSYFEQNKTRFTLPEKTLVHYVQFPVADELANVSVTDQMVSEYYEANKQRFLKEDTAEGAEPEAKPIEEVQDEIKEQIEMNLARQIAANKADDIVSALSKDEGTFESIAQEKGLTIVKSTPPFAATDVVKGVDPTAPFQRESFKLNNDETHYYSDPVVGRDFVYVIKLVKKLPAFIPEFDVIKDDAKNAAEGAAQKAAYIEEAQAMHKAISAELLAGSTFKDALSPYKLDTTTTVEFDASTTLEDANGDKIKGAALLYDQNKLTDLISTADGYVIAYVATKTPGDEATELPAMRDELTQNLTSEKAMHLVAAWRDSLLEEAEFEDFLNKQDDES